MNQIPAVYVHWKRDEKLQDSKQRVFLKMIALTNPIVFIIEPRIESTFLAHSLISSQHISSLCVYCQLQALWYIAQIWEFYKKSDHMRPKYLGIRKLYF